MLNRRGESLLRKGVAAFLMLILMTGNLSFAAGATQLTIVEGETKTTDSTEAELLRDDEVREGNLTNSKSEHTVESEVDAETKASTTESGAEDFGQVGTVEIEAADEESEEALEEIKGEKSIIIFSQTQHNDRSVKLYKGKNIEYENYHTGNFSVECDGKKIVAYCIEPTKNWGGKGSYTAKPYNAELITKTLYYSYANPGYDKYTKPYLDGVSRKNCYKGRNGEYALCHIALSYIYDGESDKGDAFKGCSNATKRIVKNFVAKIKTWPDPPKNPKIALSKAMVNAEWDFDADIQKTEKIEVLGTEGNSILLPIPVGATVHKGEELIQAGSTEIKVGESFSISAPRDVQGEYSSPNIASSLVDFQPYILQPKGKQKQVFSLSTVNYVSYKVQWADFGRLDLIKESSRPDITDGNSYYSLEGAEYGLYHRNEDAVITDTEMNGVGGSDAASEEVDNSGEARESDPISEKDSFESSTYEQLIGKLVTDSNGRASLGDIPYGKYRLRELRAPEGYELDFAEYDITINSEAQSETLIEVPLIPDIVTSAVERGTGNKSVEEGGIISISDTVKYEGVRPKVEYKMTGRLMNKETGEELPETAQEVFFTPEKSEGSLRMEYSLNSEGLGGDTVVAFEKLYQGNNLVATHEDIDNEAQSVNIVKPKPVKLEKLKGNPPETGDRTNMIDMFLMALIAAMSLILGTAAIMHRD